MKKILVVCLVVLMAVGGTSALAKVNFRDKAEGPEANPSHAEGVETKYQDGEESDGNEDEERASERAEKAHVEGNDKGNGEESEGNEDQEDGAEGPESNSTHAEGQETKGEDSRDGDTSNSIDNPNEGSHAGDND